MVDVAEKRQPWELIRFLHAAAQPGVLCQLCVKDPTPSESSLGQDHDVAQHSSTVEAVLHVTRENVLVTPSNSSISPLVVNLDHLKRACVATDSNHTDVNRSLPQGLSSVWADFVVCLVYFEASAQELEERTLYLLMGSDTEARLLAHGIAHLQRFGIPPPRAPAEELAMQIAFARARAAFKVLGSPTMVAALQSWRTGAVASWEQSVRHAFPPRSSSAASSHKIEYKPLTSLWKDTTQGVWDVLSSPVLLGTRPDPALAAGWDVPMPPGLGACDLLEAEGELSDRWERAIRGRPMLELTRSELRAAFVIGDRIPWQYRLVLWPAWLEVDSYDDSLQAPDANIIYRAGSNRSKLMDEGSKTVLHQSQSLLGLLADAPSDALSDTCRRQIERDLPRTRPGELALHQRESLGRVLRAYAVRAPHINYCQGMNFIVAMELLCGFTEKQALAGLECISRRFCDGYYDESMRGLLRDVAALDALMLLMLPKVHARLVEIDLPLIWIAAEPLLTLFSRELKPIESVCRIWDFLLIEGQCAPFAVFLAYAQLAFERNLLTSALPEDSVAAFRLLLGDAGAIAGNVLRRAAAFLAPRPIGGGLDEGLLERLRSALLPS